MIFHPIKWLKRLLFVVIIGVAAFFALGFWAKQDLKNLSYPASQLSTLNDGEYYGSAKVAVVEVQVKVIVENHQITDIEILKHTNGLGKKAEVLTEQMVAANSWQVDAVSGATMSSEALKSAVAQALGE
ncbi:MAG: FMN-binding protein [Erysipelotrichaceae bacterium]|jgi:uncharacterized protein with FMN-binding domain|nr:FMN-binding protein [Erysipelotrichaceae bacterium]